ncbi:hypothetical protein BT96DRAFT_846293 [Gymnopus androsaceus JB14]|uniref:DUF1917-domain-containing protein n=1 Tax=Gymnopus androsaceus JB14 TaxID=1447944 RepID=A0A6A4IMD4_9AGAR|nr:hypothetical protein BT96DRAFT_846293 [Gymnopus androsaceus JB14]
MAQQSEDVISAGYKYTWDSTSNSGISLKEYLEKYKPSMVENDGLKPWIWVRNGNDQSETANESAALKEGTAILKDVTERVESIKNDPAIPARSSKKTGAKGKKEVREELQSNATEKFKEIAQKYNYTCGKWLMFVGPDRVDKIWSSLATSLVEGPLASTPAFCAKVATTPRVMPPNYQHVICLYMPNVYDKDTVTEVMKILIRNHGFTLSGVKSDMYTLLGIDSKHPSGIQSTIWKNKDLMEEKEMKALKEAFYKKGKSTNAESSGANADSKPANAPVQSTSKAKPKKKKNDFASDEEDDGMEQQRKEELIKRKKASAVSKRANDSDDDVEEVKPKRKIVKRS